MSEIIPYEKDIKFDTKIYEITSISLEHEEDFRTDDIEGYFIINGDYKIHPISVNKEEFKFKIPFNIELSETINKDSIKLEINDFTYDIKDNDTLSVKIELSFNYELKEDEEELDREIENLITNEEVQEQEEQEEQEQTIEEHEEQKIITKETKEDTYVTYHIHLVTKEDNIESICLKYNIDKNTIYEYNNIEDIKENDKILIPIKDE